MKIADVMTRGLELMSADDTVQQAALKMAEADIGALLIGTVDALEGILTDRDIILRMVVDGQGSAEVRVRDIMSSTLFTCRENDSLEQAFAEMRDHQVRRLPVLDETDRLVGIVTLSDLCRHDADPQRTSELLRAVAEPHRDRRSDKPAESERPDEAPETEASAPDPASGPPEASEPAEVPVDSAQRVDRAVPDELEAPSSPRPRDAR